MAVKYTVRSANAEDLEEVSRLFELVVTSLDYYNLLAKEAEIKKNNASRLSERLAADPFSILVALDDDENIIGFSFSHFNDYTVYLDWFGVEPTLRRNGVGKSLLENTFEASRKRGAHKIWCDSRSTNEPSKNLLRKVGFREIVEVKDHWYRQDFVFWQRYL
jgi:ribosomal protein S18 acetylase RimI-like enzyme